MACSYIESLSQRHRDVAALDAYFLQAPGHTSVYGPMVECLNNSDLSRFPCGTVSDLRFLYVEYLRFDLFWSSVGWKSLPSDCVWF